MKMAGYHSHCKVPYPEQVEPSLVLVVGAWSLLPEFSHLRTYKQLLSTPCCHTRLPFTCVSYPQLQSEFFR